MAAQICDICKHKKEPCYCAPNSTCSRYEMRNINQYDKIKSMNINELSEWLDQYGQFDGSPWMEWWNDNYCSKCPSEIGYITDSSGENEWKTPCEFGWCELHDKCKFFEDLEDVPDNKEIIKMWLESEIDAKSINSED